MTHVWKKPRLLLGPPGVCHRCSNAGSLGRPVEGIEADFAPTGVGREDARQFYSDLDPRAFLPPDPADTELGQALLDRRIQAAEHPERLIRVADLDGDAVGFRASTLRCVTSKSEDEQWRISFLR